MNDNTNNYDVAMIRHQYTPDPYGQNIMKPPAPCPNCGTCPTCGHGPVIYRQGWPWDRPGTTAPIWWVQPTVICGPGVMATNTIGP